MEKTIPIYDYPEFSETLDDLLDKLLNESGRGAILIGTSYVEEHLEKFILKILPNNQKKYTSRLLNYPGPLSSFSAKLELSYAFRLIPEDIYNALNNLRKYRNEAAHSSKDFCLTKLDLDKVFNLGEGWRTMINESSASLMLKLKVESLKISLSKIDGMDEEKINESISSKFQEKDSMEILEKQWPHWKLILGLSFICGLLRFYSDETLDNLGSNNTWSSIKTMPEKD